MKITTADWKAIPKHYENITEVLDSGRLSYGDKTEELEKKFAEKHDCQFALFTSSGTTALQLSLAALKEKYKWESHQKILVPATTFVASMNTIIHAGLQPVFVDVLHNTFDISPTEMESTIDGDTVGVMPVHILGQSCDMLNVSKIARDKNITVIEDSCETVGVSNNGKSVGSIGEVGCFSTYMAHLMIAGIGGFVTTNDADLATKMRSLMFHGRDNIYLKVGDDDRTGNELVEVVKRRFNFERVGFNFRASEFEAAIGLVELEELDENIKSRRKNVDYLRKELGSLNQYFYMVREREEGQHGYMHFPIVLRQEIERQPFIEFLEANRIMTRELLPLINQPVVKSLYGDIEDRYPVAKMLNRQGMLFGCHQYLMEPELEYLVEKIYEYFREKI